MLLRIILPTLFAILFFTFFPKSTFAITCCVNHGGEYACDYSSGKLYCKDGTLSTDCTCKKVTPTPTPSTKPTPAPTLPACVPNSTYDKTLKGCKCNSGYIIEGNTCVSLRDYCWHNFGSNTTYNSEKDSCVCSGGYLWDEGSSSCITYNKICQIKLGDKSYYNSGDNTCNCYEGYYINNNECALIPTPIISPEKLETKVVVDSASEPSPTSIQEIRITSSPTPTDEPKIIINDGGSESFTTDVKPQKNIIKKVIENIWNFITSIF